MPVARGRSASSPLLAGSGSSPRSRIGAGAAGAGTRPGRGGVQALSRDLEHAGRLLGRARSDRSCHPRRRTGNRARLSRRVRAVGREQRRRLGTRSRAALPRTPLGGPARNRTPLLAALEAHAEGTRPFERARSELAYGEFLRRARRRVEARDHLRAALDGFEGLGATLWAERPGRAAGERPDGAEARPEHESRDSPNRSSRLPVSSPRASPTAKWPRSSFSAAHDRLPPPQRLQEARISSRTALARLDLDSGTFGAPHVATPAIPPARASVHPPVKTVEAQRLRGFESHPRRLATTKLFPIERSSASMTSGT